MSGIKPTSLLHGQTGSSPLAPPGNTMNTGVHRVAKSDRTEHEQELLLTRGWGLGKLLRGAAAMPVIETDVINSTHDLLCAFRCWGATDAMCLPFSSFPRAEPQAFTLSLLDCREIPHPGINLGWSPSLFPGSNRVHQDNYSSRWDLIQPRVSSPKYLSSAVMKMLLLCGADMEARFVVNHTSRSPRAC